MWSKITIYCADLLYTFFFSLKKSELFYLVKSLGMVVSSCMYLDICLINSFVHCLLPHVHMCLSSSCFCGHISLSSVKQLWLTGPRKAAADRCWTCLADWCLSIFVERSRRAGAGASFAPQLLGPTLVIGAQACSLYLTVSLLLPPVTIWGLLSIYIFLILPLFSSSVSYPVIASIWWFWPEPKPPLCSFLTSLHLPALPPLMDS